MMWRRPVDELEPLRDEQGRLSAIPVELDCGHVRINAHRRKCDGLPVIRQWCSECHVAKRPAPNATAVVTFEPEDARMLATLLRTLIYRRDVEHPDIWSRIADIIERSLP